MNTRTHAVRACLICGILMCAQTTLAQQPPGGRPDGPNRPEGVGRQDGPGRADRPDRPPRSEDGPRPPGQQIEMMRGYLDVVDRYSRMSRDPVAAGIGAVITANDILRPRGADAAIEYFTKILPDVKNEAVQRAIRSMLIDLYKTSGQQDKALEQLSELIKGAPAGTSASGGDGSSQR
ncbi:MAG: hypothetical protein ACREJC_20775 [Tepidisphaeraceae bacterium]